MAPQLRDHARYDILGEHGRGGLGRVSRAHDRELGRDIAIKELISRGQLSEMRFLREALITARLEHPGIVPVYEAGRWSDGTPFYAMKLVAGRPLRDLILERTTVEERISLLHHVIAVADAMAYAHGRNIIHRDLKPSNVIVGDFGETVVIDWGLAKDLAAAEEPLVGGGPFRTNQDDGLTSTGTILGTPAYMAPEQARGEPVNQRADVFAIGAMLWELCSLHKLPPSFSGQRRHAIRRAGIDPDLAVIIEKACDPDPARRYPDAGGLASDLKAFKAGARIAARRYSLWALLAHWIRRHRMMAGAGAAALVVAVISVTLYIRSIARERDRADASEATATRERASAQRSLDELTLNHAELLLNSDPSAALDALAEYRGRDAHRANLIGAEAVGRGVALLRATPHTDNVRWTETAADGTIISLSFDGTIVRTSLQGTSSVIVRGVAHIAHSSYTGKRQLLAYTCDPSDLCLYDVQNGRPIAVASILKQTRPAGISFSPDGNLLASMSQDAVLHIFDVSDPVRPVLKLSRAIRDGNDVQFVDDEVVVAATENRLDFIRIEVGDSSSVSVPGNSYWDSSSDEHLFATSTIYGEALLFHGASARPVAQATLCRGAFAGLRFLPRKTSIAYACRDGLVGIWYPNSNSAIPRMHLGHADVIAVSDNGEYLIVGGEGSTVFVLDLKTDLITSYKGHTARLTSITPPTAIRQFLVSADASGSMRAWPLPRRLAKVAAFQNLPFQQAFFATQSGRLIASAAQTSLITFSPSAGLSTLAPHELWNIYLAQSPHGNTFATFGLNGIIELWSLSNMSRTKIFDTMQGSISKLDFWNDTDDVITSGHDGRLMRWNTSGDGTLIARLDQPVELFVITSTDSIVFSSADGALWRTDSGGRPHALRSGGSRVTQLVTDNVHSLIYAGYANGEAIVIDANNAQHSPALRAQSSITKVSLTPDGRTIVVATSKGVVHIGRWAADGSRFGTITWTAHSIHASRLGLTSDGTLVALSNAGLIWIYSTTKDRWLCQPSVLSDPRYIAIDQTSDAAAALDVEGRIVWIDLVAVHTLLQQDTDPFGR